VFRDDLFCRFESDGINARFELIDFIVVQTIELIRGNAPGELC